MLMGTQHIGLAFQLVDDALDFTGTSATLGKPALSDMKQGLSTAPVLFASEQHPELIPLMERGFNQDGDVADAETLVRSSDGLARTRALSIAHAQKAVDALSAFADSPARDALSALALKVIDRTH
jgi:hexaprenyl-diphosphate synthase